MDKEKCYKSIEKCKEEMEAIINECKGKDGNAIYLAQNLIKDLDRLKRCISIDVPRLN